MGDNLNLDSSPDLFDSNSSVENVRKLNKLPLILFFLLVILIVGAIIYAILDKANRGKGNISTQQEANVNKENKSDLLVNQLLKDAIEKNKKKEIPPIPKEKNILIETPTIQQTKQLAPQKKLKSLSQKGNLLSKEEEARRKLKEAMLNDAIMSTTQAFAGGGVSSAHKNSSKGGIDGDLPAGIGSSLGVLKDYMKMSLNKPKEKIDLRSKNEMFIDETSKNFSYLSHQKRDLISKFEIKTGTIIPAILITGMNSELPGQTLAQVSENVYDTVTGKYLLIPQGTKIVGTYNSGVEYGQSRLLATWNRLLFPDGKTLNIGSMIGTDKQGYSGFDDEVDNHYFRIFGSAFLLSIIGGDIMIKDGKLTFSSGKAKSTSQGNDKRESLLEKTGSKMIEKNMDLAPTISVRPGYKFNIFVTKDMILEPLRY